MGLNILIYLFIYLSIGAPLSGKLPFVLQRSPIMLLRLTHTSGLSYGCGFGEVPSDATEAPYAECCFDVTLKLLQRLFL